MKRPTHPAEVLKEFIGEDKIMPLSKASNLIECHEKTLERILDFNEDKEKNRGMSQELGWKIAKAFGTSKEFWNDMQRVYDLWEEVQKNSFEPVMKFNKDDKELVNLMVKFEEKNEKSNHPAFFLQPFIGEGKKYSVTEASLIIGVPRKTLSDFLQFDEHKENNVELSSKMALKLESSLGIPAQKWIDMQSNYNEKKEQQKEQIPKEVAKFIRSIQNDDLEKAPENAIEGFVKNKKASSNRPR